MYPLPVKEIHKLKLSHKLTTEQTLHSTEKLTITQNVDYYFS